MLLSWRPARRAALRAVAAAGFVLIASGTALAQSPETLHTLHIVAGKVPRDEQRIEAHQGDRLRLRVSSDVPGELHLHAYRLSLTLKSGEVAELPFSAFATGRFQIEFHPAKASTAPAGGHEAAPLATLEVRPT